MEFFILFVMAIAGFMGFLFYREYLAEKQRTAELQQVAGELGFDFVPEGQDSLHRDLARFPLFSLGRSDQLKNLLRGRTSDLEVAIFDFRYVIGSGKNRQTFRQTVIAFQFQEPRLPTFSLRPENLWHKVGAWFGYQDFDFENHPGFSGSYLLRGDSEDAVRRLFADPVLDWFEQHPGLSVEAGGQRLLFYRSNDRVVPAKVRELMEEGFQVLKLFRP